MLIMLLEISQTSSNRGYESVYVLHLCGFFFVPKTEVKKQGIKTSKRKEGNEWPQDSLVLRKMNI